MNKENNTLSRASFQTNLVKPVISHKKIVHELTRNGFLNIPFAPVKTTNGSSQLKTAATKVS